MVAYLLSVLSGAVLPLAFAPFAQFWIAPLSYAGLFYAWQGSTPKRAFGLGFAYGCASFGFGTYWTYIAVREFGEVERLRPNRVLSKSPVIGEELLASLVKFFNRLVAQ